MDAVGPWLRELWIGSEPPWFLLEIVLRTLVLYFWTFALFRLIGTRAVGQLSVIELLLVIALGSAVGDPMFYPDVPLLHGMLVIAVVVTTIRTIGWIADRNERAELWLEGRPMPLVRDGVMDRDAMDRAAYPHDRLFEDLRLHGVEQLGEVRVAYLEKNGRLSVFRQPPDQEREGLAIEPPPEGRSADGNGASDGEPLACLGCGRPRAAGDGPADRCRCGRHDWAPARGPVRDAGDARTSDARQD